MLRRTLSHRSEYSVKKKKVNGVGRHLRTHHVFSQSNADALTLPFTQSQTGHGA